MKSSDIKNNLNRRVMYHGVEYIFDSVTVFLGESGYEYIANIKDISAKSSYIVTDVADLRLIE